MGGEGEGSHPIALKGIHRVPLRTALKREWEEAVNPFVRRRRWRRVPREGKGGGGRGGEARRGCLRYLLGPRLRRRMQAALAELVAAATLS